METIQKNTVVQLDFSLITSTGSLVDERHGFSYIHGYNTILRGMESILDGKSKGDVVHTELIPAEAFGEYVEERPIHVHRQNFGENFDRMHVGMGLSVKSNNGEHITLYVERKDASHVMLSRNHPLAGESIVFTASILDIRPASPEEVTEKTVLKERPSNDSGSCSCC